VYSSMDVQPIEWAIAYNIVVEVAPSLRVVRMCSSATNLFQASHLKTPQNSNFPFLFWFATRAQILLFPISATESSEKTARFYMD
jgi:hypothetical protein